jgi:hypothetical protein
MASTGCKSVLQQAAADADAKAFLNPFTHAAVVVVGMGGLLESDRAVVVTVDRVTGRTAVVVGFVRRRVPVGTTEVWAPVTNQPIL